MNSVALFRRLRLASLLSILALAAGCAGMVPPGIARHGMDDYGNQYEYRYRVFQAGEPMPASITAPVSESLLADRFLPAAAFNRSMELLAQDGFELWKIERVNGTEDQYVFSFRRPLPGNFRPTRAPAELTGVFQAQKPASPARYYSLAPRYLGYSVFIFEGSGAPKLIDADWDAKEKVLHAQEGPLDHTFMLAADGMTITHITEEVLTDRFNRQVVTAFRLQSGK